MSRGVRRRDSVGLADWTWIIGGAARCITGEPCGWPLLLTPGEWRGRSPTDALRWLIVTGEPKKHVKAGKKKTDTIVVFLQPGTICSFFTTRNYKSAIIDDDDDDDDEDGRFYILYLSVKLLATCNTNEDQYMGCPSERNNNHA